MTNRNCYDGPQLKHLRDAIRNRQGPPGDAFFDAAIARRKSVRRRNFPRVRPMCAHPTEETRMHIKKGPICQRNKPIRDVTRKETRNAMKMGALKVKGNARRGNQASSNSGRQNERYNQPSGSHRQAKEDRDERGRIESQSDSPRGNQSSQSNRNQEQEDKEHIDNQPRKRNARARVPAIGTTPRV